MKLESLDLNLLLVFDALATERSVTQGGRESWAQPTRLEQRARPAARIISRSASSNGARDKCNRRRVPASCSSHSARRSRNCAKLLRPRRPFGRTHPTASSSSRRTIMSILLLPRVVQRLQRDAPSVALRTVRTDYLFLSPGRAFAIGRTRFGPRLFRRNTAAESGLLSQTFVNGRLVSFVPCTTHPRAGRQLSLRTFVETPHVRVMYPGTERQGSIDTILHSRGLSRRIAVTVPHYLTIPAIVAKSNLLGSFPRRWRRAARSLRLKIFDPPIALPDITVMMTGTSVPNSTAHTAGFANASPPRARRSPDYRFFLRETISPVLGGNPSANPTTP